uniref:Uncharacterized protein n=1 Tax=Anopheles maculatus TaxID=74869 RepID=A0A182T2L0_9DIPT
MILRHASVLVSFMLCLEPIFCSICLYHGFHEKFFTDLNYIIDDFDSDIWYVVAFQQPNLPYRTLYHVPQDIASNRNCYSYTLRTRVGVILMELVCRDAQAAYDTFDIFTRPNGMYIVGSKGSQEVRDFRVVHVMQLTQTSVLLISCSAKMNTYGMLVLNREPPTAKDTHQVHKMIESKLPYPLYRWLNYTVTSVSVDGEARCSCINHFVKSLDYPHDKRKGFVLITLLAAAMLLGLVKVLKRFWLNK